MPAHQRIGSEDRIELQQRSASDRFGLSREQRSFRIAESDAPTTQPLFEQSILCLQELDNDELVTVDPASCNH